VLESICVDVPRPRRLAGHPDLQALRERLQRLFQSLETQPEEL
jgi:hypothetical protein